MNQVEYEFLRQSLELKTNAVLQEIASNHSIAVALKQAQTQSVSAEPKKESKPKETKKETK